MIFRGFLWKFATILFCFVLFLEYCEEALVLKMSCPGYAVSEFDPTLPHYAAPPPCKRPRRVGLSRKQKLRPLHARYKRPED